MVHINFQEPVTDKWKEWRKKCNDKQKECIANFANGEPLEIDDKLYKELKQDVYVNNGIPFYGKCSYCEQKIYSDQHGDIEHFRPKSRITDENNKPIEIEKDGTMEKHPGYYWLIYDWKNLLPSCVLCNRPSTTRSDGRLIGKWDQFPVKKFRAINPGDESKEEPLLINPIIEQPENFINVDETGVFSSINVNERGSETIEILGLNDRDLPNSRKAKYDDVKLKMRALAHSMANNPNNEESKTLLKCIIEIQSGEGEYTLISRKAIKDSLSNLGSLFENLAS